MLRSTINRALFGIAASNPRQSRKSLLTAIVELARNMARDMQPLHWHEASAVPLNQDLELYVDDSGKARLLPFPCRQTNVNGWINVELGRPVEIKAVKWRPWRYSRPPQPHYLRLRLSDNGALVHARKSQARSEGSRRFQIVK